MNAKTKKIALSMLSKGLCSQEEINSGHIPQDRIDMFVKGVEIINGEPTIIGQIRAYQSELLKVEKDSSLSDNERRGLRHSYMTSLRKLKQLQETSMEEEVSTQVKMTFTGAKTQREEVIKHLEEHGNITSFEAFVEYGITRLSAIIYDLRHEMNMSIKKITISRKNRYGNIKNFAKYILEK